MKHLKIFFILVLFFTSCSNKQESNESSIDRPSEAGFGMSFTEPRPEPTPNLDMVNQEDLIGYWVGLFQSDISKEHRDSLHANEIEFSYYNKINISINQIVGDSIFGHSVVANNFTPFKGTLEYYLGEYQIKATEPGNGKYDGEFEFAIAKDDSVLRGSWTAFNSIPVNKRKYELEKMIFVYDSSHKVHYYQDFRDTKEEPGTNTIDDIIDQYGTANKAISFWAGLDTMHLTKLDKDAIMDEILEQWNMTEEKVASTSPAMYNLNASRDLLTELEVANLKKLDIYILRNSIFARHGYSFKDKMLRAYFDNMRWYIPVHSNVAVDLTYIEKHNIELLLRYEEHAEQYYDEFGR